MTQRLVYMTAPQAKALLDVLEGKKDIKQLSTFTHMALINKVSKAANYEAPHADKVQSKSNPD